MWKFILLLAVLPALAQASNACLIDGRTVFQKEPCPVQEAENVSGKMSYIRRQKEAEHRQSAAADAAVRPGKSDRMRRFEEAQRANLERSRRSSKAFNKFARRAINKAGRGR